jgi:hypothetical protein
MDRMAQQPNKYYRPYLSDSDESDTDDTGSTTSSWSSGSDHQPNYRQFASQLQLSKAAGPDFPTNHDQILFQNPKSMDVYASDVSGIVFPDLISSKTPVTSIIMLDSRDRDTNVYLQPTNLTLRLPRTYKMITNFQIIQINMLSSFFYFRADKNNLNITIQEQGRYLQDTLGITKTALNSTLYPISINIREGTYTIDTLVDELNLQLNRTPIFYDFQNGINDFASQFIASGDYSINFNQPGDNFFDSVNNVFILKPTLSQIVQKYFQSILAGKISYTIEQVKVAYYYPVLKEFLLDLKYGPTMVDLNITNTSSLLTDETIFTRCVYTFEGLDDIIVQQVIDKNISVLDTYRLKNTFRYYLINEYSVSYAKNNNYISITSSFLKTSLVTLLTSKYNQYFTNALITANLTLEQYSAQITLNTLLLAVLTDMYNYMQIKFSTYFGINFNSYSLDYYASINNQFPLQNAINNTGIAKSFTLNTNYTNLKNTLEKFNQQSTNYWPQLTNLTNTINNVDNTSAYNIIADVVDPHMFIQTDGTLYQNPIFRSVNVVAKINQEQYTVFTFKSLARQTLRVTSLPRPTKYRYTKYNAIANYTTSIKNLFNGSYSFVNTANIDVSNKTIISIPGFLQSDANYGIYVSDSLNKWGTTYLTFNPINTVNYLSFWTPLDGTISTYHKYTLNFSISYAVGVSPPTLSTILFLYHDRGAFMADIQNVYNENPLHYKQKWLIKPSEIIGVNGTRTYGVVNTISPTGVSDPSYTSLYAGQQYYLLFRSQSSTVINIENFRVSPYFPLGSISIQMTENISLSFNPLKDSNSTDFNYAVVNDPDYIKLPISPSLWSKNSNADSNYTSFGSSLNPMGYDPILGASTDLTDYIGYTSLKNYDPTSKICIDPITKYTFYVGLGYNSTTQTYLDITSAFGNNNKVVPPTNVNLTQIIPTTRQTVIAHWYSQIFITNTINQIYISPSNYYQSPANAQVGDVLVSYPYVQDIVYPNPFSQSTTLSPQLLKYTFNDKYLSLGNGVIGISLVPDDGIWDVNKIMLRSAFINSNVNSNLNNINIDPNRDIMYLGIFPSCYINTLLNTQISLSNAIMTFKLSSAVTYSSDTDFDKGTYYEWIQNSRKQYIYGYAQTPGKILADSNAYYSIVPFTSDSNLTTYNLLSGSLVPYPLYSEANSSATYLDGTSTPDGKYVIYPTKKKNADPALGPPIGFDQTQSKYEQSTPIGSTLLQYLQPPSQFITFPFDISGSLVTGPITSLKDVIGSAPFTNICTRVKNYILYDDDGNYTVYKYDNNALVRKFYLNTYESSLTQDLFFINYPNTSIVAISGNKTVFAFLGLSASPYGNNPTLYEYTFIIELYNPVTHKIDTVGTIVINIKTTPPNTGLFGTSTYPLLQGLSGCEITGVDSFNYNDNDGFTFVIQYRQLISPFAKNSLGITKGSPVNDVTPDALPFYLIKSPPTNAWARPGTLPATYQILQSTYEPFGRFYIAAKTFFDTVNSPKSPATSIKYKVREPMLVNSIVNSNNPNYAQNGLFYINPNNNDLDLSIGSIDRVSLSNIQAPYISQSNTTIGPSIIRLNLLEDTIKEAAFGDITLLQNPYENKIILSYDMLNMSNNNGLPSVTWYQGATYEVDTINSSNLKYIPSSNQLIKDNANSPICPYQVLGGGGGSFWLLFNEKNCISPNLSRYNSVWGNLGDNQDFPVNIENAYQIFYPTQRIVMTKMNGIYNPLTDLSGVVYDGSPQILYPEYPHTAIFAYDTLEKLNNDISTKWGNESQSNYLTADYGLSNGYYFNACDLEVPLLSNATYYIALRGYSPTETSQVMMRFSLPNRYDFGYITINQLIDEIAITKTNTSNFNSNYLNAIQSFNSNFIFSSYTFGSGIVQGYNGTTFTNITGFSNFYEEFTKLYIKYNKNLSIVTNINTYTQSNLQNFITNDLSTIIPLSAKNRQRYTDPVVYSILWKTALSSQYQKLNDNWGLGWNLGYDKVDTPYLTTQVAQNFYKILDEYINLRMNVEFNMNHMDTGFKENLQITKDPTGSTNSYYGKLLLNSFGFYSQTMISNPVIFQVPIPKVDKLTFTWYDNTGNVINNKNCEWTAVVQIIELLDIVNVPPAIITPQ